MGKLPVLEAAFHYRCSIMYDVVEKLLAFILLDFSLDFTLFYRIDESFHHQVLSSWTSRDEEPSTAQNKGAVALRLTIPELVQSSIGITRSFRSYVKRLPTSSSHPPPPSN